MKKHEEQPVEAGQRSPESIQGGGWYRAVWRWHFYAGLISIPFVVLLSVTGGINLFEEPLDRWIYREFRAVPATAGEPLSAAALVDAAVAHHPDSRWVQYQAPRIPGEAAEVTVRDGSGTPRRVFVNPADASVLGTVQQDRTFLHIVRKTHSLAIAGPYARAIIEAVAGWVVILVVTGMYLWWPRGGIRKAFRIRGRLGRRVLWRDTHAVSGAALGLVIAFLAITGLPWSNVWGTVFKSLTRASGLGSPEHIWESRPSSEIPEESPLAESWTLTTGSAPDSIPTGLVPVGVDRALEVIVEHGLTEGFSFAAPWGPTGVYTAMYLPENPAGQRVIHVDQYSGEVVSDITFDDFGGVARLTEWGIQIHMGRAFGWPNTLAMLLGCIAALFLCVSAVVMWWKRRPHGTIGVPKPAPPRTMQTVALLTLALAALFPLTALSMLLIAHLDRFMKP